MPRCTCFSKKSAVGVSWHLEEPEGVLTTTNISYIQVLESKQIYSSSPSLANLESNMQVSVLNLLLTATNISYLQVPASKQIYSSSSSLANLESNMQMSVLNLLLTTTNISYL